MLAYSVRRRLNVICRVYAMSDSLLLTFSLRTIVSCVHRLPCHVEELRKTACFVCAYSYRLVGYHVLFIGTS